MSKLTYADFYKTGMQDALNAFSPGDVDLDAGEPVEILDAYIGDPEEFRQQWFGQTEEFDDLDPVRCYREWLSGWRREALADIIRAVDATKQRRLDEMERWYLEVDDDLTPDLKRKRLIAFLTEHAEIELYVEPEHEAVEGNFDDPETVEWIHEQLRSGNEWAWCQVRVTASYGGRRGRAYLGGCSYHSRQDFEQPDGYYPQMVEEAIAELASEVRPEEVDFSEVLESFDTLEEAIEALARFNVGSVLAGDGNGPWFTVVRVDGGKLKWDSEWPSHGHHGVTKEVLTFGSDSSWITIPLVEIERLERLFERARADVAARGGEKFRENPPKRRTRHAMPPLANILFRDSIVARMLRRVLKVGSMAQAVFMQEYHLRCNRPEPTSKSSFGNNFGRFAIPRWADAAHPRDGVTPAQIEAARRMLEATYYREGAHIEAPWWVLRQDPMGGRRNNLVWIGPSLQRILETMSVADLDTAFQELEHQLVQVHPVPCDKEEETKWWIDAVHDELQRRTDDPSGAYEGLTEYLKPRSQVKSIGTEDYVGTVWLSLAGEHPQKWGERYTNRHGSVRYVLFLRFGRGRAPQAVAALQLVTSDGKNATIANVYTLPEYRRRGFATDLLELAREEYDTVKHADQRHMSDAGKAWAASDKRDDHGTLKPNPPWLTKAIADSFEGLEAKVKAAWLPKLDGVRAGRGREIHAKLREYGCGAYGCVLPTLDPNVVLKATIDITETNFARDMAATLVVPVVTHYYQVASIPAKHKDRRVYLLWRESADDVGKVDELVGERASDLIHAQHQLANNAYELVADGEHGPPLEDAFGLWLEAVDEMATLPELEYVATGMARAFREQGIFIGDTHEGNLGRCMRDGKKQWVITDPGHVVVVKGAGMQRISKSRGRGR